jgi:hypothetical protein
MKATDARRAGGMNFASTLPQGKFKLPSKNISID